MRRTRRSRAAALLGTAAVALLAAGCGIRPTAIPVDAGAPASRTSCPSPLRPPAAPATPSAVPQHGTARPFSPGPAVTAAPSLPAGSLFSALPSPTPTPSGTPHCQ
ncbi:hypothetical protein ACFYNO_04615 [Kitasatospora sp. NPDC006697]|uniref:hypothetical protein n=1 Tax=Kitasatospora sp. NPDC006697 TaxID=3364020 RepID=UPI0036BDE590